MRDFDTMTSAVQALQKEGYSGNFELRFDKLKLQGSEMQYHPNEFEITEVFRFEGMTNPSDSSILFAIETKDNQRGLLVDAYGADSDPISIEMIDKFQLPNQSKR